MERGEEGREGKIERRGLHKQESGTFEMAESERLNLSADGVDVRRVLLSGPGGVKGVFLFRTCVYMC